MTRTDWWLGILVIVLTLIVHALVMARANRHSGGSAKFVPLSVTETARTESLFKK
jgi:hypothetical protein